MFSRRPSSSPDPFAAVWAANYDRAIAQLHNDVRPGAAVMRARAYGNLGLERRVLREYAAGAATTLDPVESINYRAIVASAMCATGAGEAARALFARVEGDLARLDDPLLALTVAYYRAIGAYAAGRQAESERIVEATLARLEALPPNALVPAQSYRFEGNHLRSRLLQSRAIAAYMRDDHAGEERALVDALLCAEVVRQRDVALESNLMATLTNLFVRQPSIRARELVYIKARALHFGTHVDHRRAAIKAGLAANRAIFGSTIDAQTLGGRSTPALPYRLSACIGTLLYHAWADARAYREALDFAIAVARASDWDAPADDAANRLGPFAALVAPHDVALARDLLASFESASRRYSRLLVSARDPRRAALARFACGAIAKAEGDDARARAAFAAAGAIWSAAGVLPVGAICGLEAFALSRDPADAAPARAFLRMYPATEFAARLRAALVACEGSAVSRFPYLADGSASLPVRE